MLLGGRICKDLLSARLSETVPVGWSLSWKEKAPPLVGRATLWGAPYAGTPIRFDDLKVIKFTED